MVWDLGNSFFPGQGPIEMDLGPSRVVFVGGAPRAGTTLTHGLLCSATEVNDFSPEIQFYRGIAQSYSWAAGLWHTQTYAYFRTADELRTHMRFLSNTMLNHIWSQLGRPEILCIKDPGLTPYFADLANLYNDEVRFITVARHPFDVVRSRQEVHDKSGTAEKFGQEAARAVAEEYRAFYSSILKTDFQGRHFTFQYELIDKPKLHQILAAFMGVEKLNPERMWSERHPFPDNNAWGTPKWGKGIDMSPRLSPLAPELAELTADICRQEMEAYGYEAAAAEASRDQRASQPF